MVGFKPKGPSPVTLTAAKNLATTTDEQASVNTPEANSGTIPVAGSSTQAPNAKIPRNTSKTSLASLPPADEASVP